MSLQPMLIFMLIGLSTFFIIQNRVGAIDILSFGCRLCVRLDCTCTSGSTEIKQEIERFSLI